MEAVTIPPTFSWILVLSLVSENLDPREMKKTPSSGVTEQPLSFTQTDVSPHRQGQLCSNFCGGGVLMSTGCLCWLDKTKNTVAAHFTPAPVCQATRGKRRIRFKT